MKTGCGWLGQLTNPTDKQPIFMHGVTVPRWSEREQAYFPTRVEEYTFVADVLQEVPRGYLVDAGAGFNSEIHVMSEIAGKQGFDVIAIDAEEASLVMPARPNVVRYRGDIMHLPVLDATAVAWICVSTLEHLTLQQRALTLQEAYRVLKPGGVLVATADELPPEMWSWMIGPIGFGVGEAIPFDGTHLAPRVGWCVAQKPTIA